jgi:pimeloyl-ACP methyl ester carboxylesterase
VFDAKLASLFATEHGDKVEKLVLYAPVYSHEVPAWTKNLKDPNNPDQIKPDIGAYRLVSEEAAKSRWGKQIVPEDKTEWREERVFKAWIDDIMATSPEKGKHSPPMFRAPNGVLIDIFYIFTKRPVYDASKITVPTLIIRGDDDPTATEPDAKGLMSEINAPIRRCISIANGTHFVNLEKNRLQLYREVQTLQYPNIRYGNPALASFQLMQVLLTLLIATDIIFQILP